MNFADCLHIVLVIGKYTDILRGFFFVGGVSGERVMWEDRSVGKRIPMTRVLHFPALFKKKLEIKFLKNKFFQLKVRSNIKT